LAYSFVLTGGGTGGHVFPALAVGEVLRKRGHRLLYIGTKEGMEARLVNEAGYEMAYIRASALKRVGIRQQLATALHLPASIASARNLLREFQPQAVFSLGGFVAGPVMGAAVLQGTPLVIMEPNAIPGFANRRVANRVYRALVGFESTRSLFPSSRAEVTGVPVRSAFFDVQPKREGTFTVLITGGSRGARTLNNAARESWPLFREAKRPLRLILQAGFAEHESLAAEFAGTGLEGGVVPFVRNMAEAFADADLVIARSGAGSVNEIAAAGMPSVLVPFPFAADNHQQKNAEALTAAGGARMVLNREMNGKRLFQEVQALQANQSERDKMRMAVRQFAHPGAAERAADVLEEAAQSKLNHA
jgi:UDP-N-acetylglucosamine--N-acetylmuramyl-(pentapeptide) pyrophosphoryl-undecaprenol N-acetylglucosamine transferase